VRAVLATRLNMVLTGSPGLQPAYVQTYVDMLNKNVLPVVPSKGSIGQADITILGHTALAMIGEGDVTYQGKRMPALDAFQQAGIKTVEPYGKDALAILSTNATASASPPCKAKNWRSSTACSTSSMPSRSKA
jgi:phenylalanine and histidine ammonia-lyase